MPGHIPLLLQTAPSSDEANITGQEVLDKLSSDYFLKFSFPNAVRSISFNPDREDYAYGKLDKSEQDIRFSLAKHSWLRIDGMMLIGAVDLGVAIIFEPVSKEDRRTVIKLELSGNLYDAIYYNDMLERRLNRALKKSIIQFCSDITNAAHSEGFVLRRLEGNSPTFDADLLRQSFLDPIGSLSSILGLMNGLLLGPDGNNITTSKFQYIHNGFLLLDFLHAEK